MRDFPGGPVVKTLPSNAGGVDSIPGWGADIPHTSGPKKQNIKQKQYCNKFNKDFPHQKKKAYAFGPYNPNLGILTYRNRCSGKYLQSDGPFTKAQLVTFWYLHIVLVTILCNKLPKFSGLK